MVCTLEIAKIIKKELLSNSLSKFKVHGSDSPPAN